MCSVTPWAISEDWMRVYNWIAEDNVNHMESAIQSITVWKNRVERLPAGLFVDDCTLKETTSFLSFIR